MCKYFKNIVILILIGASFLDFNQVMAQSIERDGLLWRAVKNERIIYLFATSHHKVVKDVDIPRGVWLALSRSDIVLTEFNNDPKYIKEN